MSAPSHATRAIPPTAPTSASLMIELAFREKNCGMSLTKRTGP